LPIDRAGIFGEQVLESQLLYKLRLQQVLTAGFLMARVADWDAFSRRLLYTPPAPSTSLLHNSHPPFDCPSTLVSALFDVDFGVEFSREACVF
jgi:hypothetical protein